MTKQELQDYLEQNSTGYNTFISKATDDQLERNKRRAPAKRWNETKINRATEKMWKDVVTNMYDKLKAQIGKTSFNGYEKWVEFINEYDVLEAFEDSMNELEFE